MKILIAVEDKKYADVIVKLVNENVWSDELEFAVLHAVEPLYVGAISGYPADVLVSYNEERHRAGRSLVLSVGTALRQAFPVAKISEEVIDGKPKEVIIERARSWPAELIVVGSHGRSGLDKFLLGSVSMSVLSAAPCSVLIAKCPAESIESDAREEKTTVSSGA